MPREMCVEGGFLLIILNGIAQEIVVFIFETISFFHLIKSNAIVKIKSYLK